MVPDAKPQNLDGVGDRNESRQLDGEPSVAMLVDNISLAETCVVRDSATGR